jgi:hypothetical protein
MTPDQQRIAIATACGWKDIRRQRLYAGDQDLWGNKMIGGEKHRNRLPDYLNDLNACHEMEQVLIDKGVNAWWEYVAFINRHNPRPFGSETAVHATASQRAEAFLRTLGLWQETPTPVQNAKKRDSVYRRTYAEVMEENL